MEMIDFALTGHVINWLTAAGLQQLVIPEECGSSPAAAGSEAGRCWAWRCAAGTAAGGTRLPRRPPPSRWEAASASAWSPAPAERQAAAS